MTKFIFVTGGVVSSIGKGITTACLGRLLRDRGYRVTMQKIDPYLNVDAGTMNPHQHGEVFVTDDGAETDLDLGHYERFVDLSLTHRASVTTGQIYGNVIARERSGDYLGKCVQVIPHITNEIKDRIRDAPTHDSADIGIVEIGGTVGDIEGLPFLEAIRQMKGDLGTGNIMYVHVTLIPFVGPAGETKTKPTQHSVRELRSIGIQPDLLVCRSRMPLSEEMREKIALFCDVPLQAVIEGLDTDSVYELPLILERQGLARLVEERLNLEVRQPDHSEWEQVVERVRHPERSCTIALVGKYMVVPDAYISVIEATRHGAIAERAAVTIKRVNAEDIMAQGAANLLSDVDGILVPGGFGGRGIEGKVDAITYARANGVPFLGLCLGMQCAVIEFARSCCGMEGAHSSEFEPESPHPVLDLLPDQHGVTDKGATMRLGAMPMKIVPGTLAHRLYGAETAFERHRHRYEVNNTYREELAAAGMVMSGVSPDDRLVEMIEIPGHPYFIATQFHPEFKSRPNRAHPLFQGLVRAALARREARTADRRGVAR